MSEQHSFSWPIKHRTAFEDSSTGLSFITVLDYSQEPGQYFSTYERATMIQNTV